MRRLLILIGLLVLQMGLAQAETKEPLRVMSFNIRMDTREDGFNQWSNRKDFACDMIRFHDADLIGTQEVLHHQLTDMQQRLPDYATIGVGREDGKEKGEYNAIFYRKDRFKLLDQHTFWLSENPEAVGKKGWDAACERVVTWAKFKDKKTRKEFYFFNTHFDHMGKIARQESCKLLKAKICDIAGNAPVIVSGDFNAAPQSSVIQALTDKNDPEHLIWTRPEADFHYGPEFSFHDYGRLQPTSLEMIDYIFVKHIKTVQRYAVITDTKGALYVSDHYPVMVWIEL